MTYIILFLWGVCLNTGWLVVSIVFGSLIDRFVISEGDWKDILTTIIFVIIGIVTFSNSGTMSFEVQGKALYYILSSSFISSVILVVIFVKIVSKSNDDVSKKE